MGIYYVSLAKYAVDPAIPEEQRVQAIKDVFQAVLIVIRKFFSGDLGTDKIENLINNHVVPRKWVYVDCISRISEDRMIPTEVSAIFQRHLKSLPAQTPLWKEPPPRA